MTARITINPPLKCSKAGIVVKPRFLGPAVLISDLKQMKEGLSGTRTFRDRTQIPDDRYKGNMVRTEQDKVNSTQWPKENSENQFCVSSA